MSILVINAGSSSIKYSLYDANTLNVIDHGLIEEISNHHEGFEVMKQQLRVHNVDITHVTAFGHRIVHGGERFTLPTLIDDSVIEEIKELTSLAPLHNPANLEGFYAARSIAPNAVHIAVFDTAFHHTMPDYAYRYALPNRLYETYHIRRYGFHGTSHSYVSAQAALLLNKPLSQLNLITLHIGNGVSACAVEKGKSIDTSMGMTPLEGLMMGTRSGSIDPGIITYLANKENMSIGEIDTLLNKQSGLLGIAGTNDMRTLIDLAQANDSNAQLAIEMFTYRLKKQLGAYMATMSRVDGIVFTGGIGEHSAHIRTLICAGLEHLGIKIDETKNTLHQPKINHDESSVKLLIIPANEELHIALQVKEILDSTPF